MLKLCSHLFVFYLCFAAKFRWTASAAVNANEQPVGCATEEGGGQPTTGCDGYFCDKTLSTMFLFMTHNSYAVDGRIWIYNQNYDEAQQFDAGIRGFNFDVYDESDNNSDGSAQQLWVDHTPHDDTWTPAPYKDGVDAIMSKLDRCEHRNEIVVVELEIKKGRGSLTNKRVVAPFGGRVITNFDASKPFSYYIERGQNVLVLSNTDDGKPSIGVHRRKDFVTQNNYKWLCSVDDDPDFAYREGPRQSPHSAKLMNHFCYNIISLPDGDESEKANDADVIMRHARMFANQPPFGYSLPNIIAVDFYDRGNIWPAQTTLRNELAPTTTTGVVAQTPPTLRPTAAAPRPPNCHGNGTFCYGRGSSSCNRCCSGDKNCPWYGFGMGCFCE